MPLNPIKHYLLESIASIYDEESLTLPQLVARVTAKLNEVVKTFNTLENDTNRAIENQYILIPITIKERVEEYINNGDFNRAISTYLNHMNERLDNLLGSVTEGSTTLDAELLDLRVDPSGFVWDFAGEAIRYNTHNRNPELEDCNIINAGFPAVALVPPSILHSPSNDTGLIIQDVCTTGGMRNFQMFFSLYSGKMYWRTCNKDSVWTRWYSVGDREEITIDADDTLGVIRPNCETVSIVLPGTGESPEPENTGVLECIVVNREAEKTNILQRFTSLKTGMVYNRQCRGDGEWSEWENVNRNENHAIWYGAGDDLNAEFSTEFETPLYGVVENGCGNNPIDGNALISIVPHNSGSTIWMEERVTRTDGKICYSRTKPYKKPWGEWVQLWDYANTPAPAPQKTVVFLGDSILAGGREDGTSIPDIFAQLTGCKVYNFALGGTHACSEGSYPEFGPHMLFPAICDGDFDAIKNAFTSRDDLPDYFETVIAEMEALDWTKVDLIVCNWGTNDYNSGCGTGVYDGVYDQIVTAGSYLPNVRFVYMTPTKRFYDDGRSITSSSYYQNSNGEVLENYVREIHNCFPETCLIVDVYNIGITVGNQSHFMNDGTHHNERGRRIIAEKLAKEVV